MTTTKNDASWGWDTLFLAIRQMIVDIALDDAMEATTFETRSIGKLCTTLTSTSRSLGQDDLPRPLMKLSEKLTRCIGEMEVARETVRHEATKHIILIQGAVDPAYATDVFADQARKAGHLCSTCMLLWPLNSADFKIGSAQLLFKRCMVDVKYWLGLLNYRRIKRAESKAGK